MKKKAVTFIFLATILIITIFFIKTNYKKNIFGNNLNKSINSVIEDILNISSYKAKVEIKVISNKNENTYEIEQEYCEPNISKQRVKKPENIKDLTIKYDGNNIVLENTRLSITKIYKDYNYINTNILWLNNFIDNYKNSSNSIIKESDEEIILEIKKERERYNYIQTLYINKKTKKPTKLEIKDNSKKNRIYIIYKEIELNNINRNEILALVIKQTKVEI